MKPDYRIKLFMLYVIYTFPYFYTPWHRSLWLLDELDIFYMIVVSLYLGNSPMDTSHMLHCCKMFQQDSSLKQIHVW